MSAFFKNKTRFPRKNPYYVLCGGRRAMKLTYEEVEILSAWAREDWELRLGPDNRFRVFYQVNAASHEVRILAVGVKIRAQLFIEGEEFKG
jgi:hypothetical protein